MGDIKLDLPDWLYKAVRELAEDDHVSINQFITLAVAEKVSALRASHYLEERAARASREAFESVLAQVPDVPPLEEDRIE